MDTERRGGAGRAEGAGSGLGDGTEMLSQQESEAVPYGERAGGDNSEMMGTAETAAVLRDR